MPTDPPLSFPEREPTRPEIDAFPGPLLLEFGAGWCGYCQALQPKLKEALLRFPEVRHLKIEDGPGRPLGRSFRVKLWPTLVFLRDGKVLKQLARPNLAEVDDGLKMLTSG